MTYGSNNVGIKCFCEMRPQSRIIPSLVENPLIISAAHTDELEPHNYRKYLQAFRRLSGLVILPILRSTV